MSGLGRCPDLRNPDLGGSTVRYKFVKKSSTSKLDIRYEYILT